MRPSIIEETPKLQRKSTRSQNLQECQNINFYVYLRNLMHAMIMKDLRTLNYDSPKNIRQNIQNSYNERKMSGQNRKR